MPGDQVADMPGGAVADPSDVNQRHAGDNPVYAVIDGGDQGGEIPAQGDPLQNHAWRTLLADPSHAPADVPDCLAHPVQVVEVVKGDQLGTLPASAAPQAVQG